MFLFIKRHQKIIKDENWRYYLKEKKLSSVKVALSIEWRLMHTDMQCRYDVYTLMVLNNNSAIT